jgi:hypothetical protein
MDERDKVLHFKRQVCTYIQEDLRVQNPQTLSEAIKIAERAGLGAKDHRFSLHNGRYDGIAIRQPITTHLQVNQDPIQGARH